MDARALLRQTEPSRAATAAADGSLLPPDDAGRQLLVGRHRRVAGSVEVHVLPLALLAVPHAGLLGVDRVRRAVPAT